MLFLFTRKLHPVVNLLIGVAALVAGVIIRADLLIAIGAVIAVLAGVRTVVRSRGNGSAR